MNKARITILSLMVAVLVYFWLASDQYLSPKSLYGIAAGVGLLGGVALNFLWKRLWKGGGK